MTYYVFIARDEEEFSRYPSFRDGFHEKAPGFLKSVRYIEEDGYCVLILPHEARKFDVEGDVDVKRMCGNVVAAINSIGHGCSDADKICILVHMGGEGKKGIDEWEKELNEKLRSYDEEEWSKNCSITLLSSTRSDVVDITAGTITIPGKDELERLTGKEGCFDSDGFINALEEYLNARNEKQWYLEKVFVSQKKDTKGDEGSKRTETGKVGPYSKEFIPLILCRSKETLRNCGVICPREYIVDLSIFEKATYEVVKGFWGVLEDSKKSHIRCAFNEVLQTMHGSDGTCESFIKNLEKVSLDKESCKKILEDIFSLVRKLINEEIIQRIEFLKPVNIAEYRAWFVPLFRKYCFQDEYAHGGSHCLELPRVGDFGGLYEREYPATKRDKKIKALIDCQHVNNNGFGEFVEKDDAKEAHWFKARFGDKSSETRDPYSKYQEFLEFLFKDELGVLKAKYKNICAVKTGDTDAGRDAWRDFKATMAVCLSELVNSPEVGLPLGYMFPTKKINVLVVDDKGKDTIEELEREEGFPKIFTFYPLTISIGDALSEGDTIVNYAIEKIRAEVESGRSYEVVLLDLSLGEDPGYDLMGYHIVYRIKQFMPQAKVVVYSKLDDMGHIVRALGNGASWYLRKYNKSKLPRHIYSMFRLLEWKKEWRTVWSNRLCDFSFENAEDNRSFISAFDGKRKYLTYKCLEKYPGVKITVKPMNDGLSRAVTFKAVKGLLVDGDPVQTPVIVKIDTAHATRLEYERYFRFIRPYIANESGRVENPEIVLDDSNAAIVYTYAGKQDPYHDLDTMKAMFVRDIKSRSSCDYQKYEKTFDSIFNEILPQIHQVSPQVEFSPLEGGCADVAARDLPGLPQTNFSDYPNHAFGEFCRLPGSQDREGDESFENGFLANYLCRMPIVRKLEGLDAEECFVPQKENHSIKKRAQNEEPPKYYEFHDKEIKEVCSITAYDPKDKCSVVMKGKAVDHIVKYRPITYPCMALWVEKKEAESELHLEEGLKYKIAAAYNEKNVALAVNKFAKAVCDFLGENLSAGRPTSAYFQQVCSRNVVGGSFFEILKHVEDKENSAFRSVVKMKDYVDKLFEDKKIRKKLTDCPIGIVHGDLNLANIMLETRKNVSKIVEFSDAVPNIRDVWFIDFARTRRDFISHDFNVMFTSVLGLLFDKDVWDTSSVSQRYTTSKRTTSINARHYEITDEMTYSDSFMLEFRHFIIAAVSGKLDAVPDFIENDQRKAFVFRVLRRIRKAALRAGISEECYLLTTALACMVASRIAIVREKNASAAAAMIATAVICLAEINA